MRGLDDGPDGLNDAAFERALAAAISSPVKVGKTYKITGRRGDAKRFHGAVGVCTFVGDDEGRGNRHSVVVTQRIALRVDGIDAPVCVAASQVTEVSP